MAAVTSTAITFLLLKNPEQESGEVKEVVKSRSSTGQSLDEFWIKGVRKEGQRLA